MTHWIEASHGPGAWPEMRALCDEPEGAQCRMVCTQVNDCEGYGGAEQHDGKWFHNHGERWIDPYGDTPILVPMVDDGECTWALWANEDTDVLREMHEGASVETIVAVTPVWHGDQGVGFTVPEDDGFVRVSWNDDGVIIYCERSECRTPDRDGTDPHRWNWYTVLDARRLTPVEIARAWYKHLISHVG